MDIILQKGQRVWFDDMKKPFKVREANDRYAICTMPYNFIPNKVIYTIVDYKRQVRGLDNMVFGTHDYYKDEDCKQAFYELLSGELEVSFKRSKRVQLQISKVV